MPRAALSRRATALAFASTLLSIASPSPVLGATEPRLRLAPCGVDANAPPGSRCGTLTVFEDRAAGTGRTIDLSLVVVPSTGAQPARHAVAFLAGGPGDGITRAAGGVAQWLAGVRPDRDLLLVDQRGTGDSNPLRCPYQEEERRFADYLDDPFSVGRLQECRQELEIRADLSLYTTPYAADDLDDVRAALGYESLDLLGGSYGTRLALVYARRHPERARTLTLLGPVPVDARIPYRLARDFDVSLRGTLADCRADAACAAAFPDLEGDLKRAFERVDAGVAPVVVPAPDGKGTVDVAVSRQLVVQALRYMLYIPVGQSGLPFALHSAAEGNFGPVASFAAMIGSAFNKAADALYLSVTCSEDVTRFTLEEGRANAAGTLIGDLRVNHQKAACALWPAGRLPAGHFDPVRLTTPALIVVGERDPATPPDWAREVAADLPNSLVVVVRQAGHEATEGLLDADCLASLPASFIAAGNVEGLDASCAATARLPPWTLAPEAPAIKLSREALAPVAGNYATPDGMRVVIELGEDGLTARGFDRTFGLEPISTERFRIVGAPPGFALELVRDSKGEVEAVVLEQGPGNKLTLPREKP
jgi:pimeloyl-ACP methyl ester carboxylesterase